MQFKAAAINQLASYICGDNPLPFPYRSSSLLTAFFTGLNFDHIHHGESRNPWTRDALIEINNDTAGEDGFPSDEMTAVIEEIMTMSYFDDDSEADFDVAFAKMNKTLKPYKLELEFDEDSDSVSIQSYDGTFVSTAHRKPKHVPKITFSPRVFEIPESPTPNKKLVAIMMPFGGFDGVHAAIKTACTSVGLESKRADDIWDNSTILQDIFDLIYAAEIVVSDFTNKNPNVMYETGIAHTLGKHVVPITQALEHVPSNLHGHRALKYVPNNEGHEALKTDLAKRLSTIISGK